MPPQTSQAVSGTSQGRINNPPSTQYVYVEPKQGAVSQGYDRFRMNRLRSMEHRQTTGPPGMPAWLGNQRVIVFAWFAAMMIISWDEWHNNGILPRPARLWYTSLFYGILALAGFITSIIPLLNALAIGYTIMLLWQYYNKGGQFANE
jgi:hypothetical protein